MKWENCDWQVDSGEEEGDMGWGGGRGGREREIFSLQYHLFCCHCAYFFCLRLFVCLVGEKEGGEGGFPKPRVGRVGRGVGCVCVRGVSE